MLLAQSCVHITQCKLHAFRFVCSLKGDMVRTVCTSMHVHTTTFLVHSEWDIFILYIRILSSMDHSKLGIISDSAHTICSGFRDHKPLLSTVLSSSCSADMRIIDWWLFNCCSDVPSISSITPRQWYWDSSYTPISLNYITRAKQINVQMMQVMCWWCKCLQT